MTKALRFTVLSLVVLLMQVGTLSRGQGGNVNAPPAATPETLTYRDLLEFQEKQNSKELQVQKEVADRAIQTASQQLQTVLVIVEIGAFLILLATAVVGWMFKRQLDRFEKLNKESDEMLSASKLKLADIDVVQNSFSARIEELTTKITPIEFKVQEFTGKLGAFQETIEDIELKTGLARIQLRLRADKLEDRLIAAQSASEIAKGARGAIAIPLLLECLDMPTAEPPVMAEALYGLSYRAKDLIGDDQAIKSILMASESPEKIVRKQALEMIGKIGLINPGLHQRIEACYESDAEAELRELAGRILSEHASN